jgi:hypothetical protein
MTPMKNSKYFQPMEHRPLPDIRKYALLTNQQSEFYAVVKPIGLDVFINDGKIYDFYHNEIQNQYLKFHFEKLLKTTIDMKMTVVGVLASPNSSLNVLRYRQTLYGATRSSSFSDVVFVAYDVIFPIFNIDHDYKLRYDIVEKVISILPNCKAAMTSTVTNEQQLQKFVKEVFIIDTAATILVFKKDGNYVYGSSQLYYDDHDVVSYSIIADQRYRAHIKKVVSTTIKMDNGNKLDIALYIIAKFKKDFIEIPFDRTNITVRRFVWEHRKDLKEHPFWFTGYTIFDQGEYRTLINEFQSFITPDRDGSRKFKDTK